MRKGLDARIQFPEGYQQEHLQVRWRSDEASCG